MGSSGESEEPHVAGWERDRLFDDGETASDSQPPFWLDTTVPNAGAPTFKARHTDLDVG